MVDILESLISFNLASDSTSKQLHRDNLIELRNTILLQPDAPETHIKSPVTRPQVKKAAIKNNLHARRVLVSAVVVHNRKPSLSKLQTKTLSETTLAQTVEGYIQSELPKSVQRRLALR